MFFYFDAANVFFVFFMVVSKMYSNVIQRPEMYVTYLIGYDMS